MRKDKSIKLFLLMMLILISVYSAFSQSDGKHVALVIGNSSYTSGPLKNPVNDATDMAKALKDIGFSVSLGTNTNKKQMYQLIEQFGTDIHGSEIALFYYSGHGVQANGENYLIPVGSDIAIASDIEIEGVQLQRLIGRMNAGSAGTNVVILDACRNNPFPQASRGMEKGLAVVGVKPPESVIVYATEAGATADDGNGRNGVFTSAFLNNIKRKEEFTVILRDVNAQVRQATNQKQTPAKYDNLTHGVYLAGIAEASVPQAPAIVAVPQITTYKIGDTGPAGGFIFYDKGNDSDGWRYFEAAPSDQSKGIQWYNGKDVLTASGRTEIGTGRHNTGLIVARQGKGNYAASLCANLSIGGFKDWFLPSKDELTLLFKNAADQGRGDFDSEMYWTSSELNASSVYMVFFRNGAMNINGKNNASYGHVRAIRAF